MKAEQEERNDLARNWKRHSKRQKQILHKWKGEVVNGHFSLLIIKSASPQFSVGINLWPGHPSDSGAFKRMIHKHETLSSCLMVILIESCDLHSATSQKHLHVPSPFLE